MSQEAWHAACGLSCSCTNTWGDPGSPIPGDPSLLSASPARAARPAGLQTLPAPASTQLPEPGSLFLHLFCMVPPAQLPETSVGGNPSLLHFPHALLCYGELLSGPRAPWNTWGRLCQRDTDAISHLCYLGHSLPNNTCKMSSNVCWDHSHASGQLQEVWGREESSALGTPNGQASLAIPGVTFSSPSGVCSEPWMLCDPWRRQDEVGGLEGLH